MAFKLASSPHLKVQLQTQTVMRRVILCALPGIAVQSYFFGFGVLIQVLLAVFVALAAESAVLALRKRAIVPTISDNSAVLTAVLIGVAIPPLAPWWLVVIGTLFAIVLVKQLYGGLGQNIFNPAMAAYVMLLISFPVQMTSWSVPLAIAQNPMDISLTLQAIFGSMSIEQLNTYKLGFDGIAMATPLDTVKTDLALGLTMTESLSKSVFSDGFGVGWFWVNMAYLVGGLVMLKLKVIRWHISFAILGSLFICSGFGYLLNPDTHVGPLMQLFSGATMIAAFFIATDPVTAATSIRGRLIFGALIGVLVYVIRTYGGYPDAFAFAVLLANLCAPFIDYYIKPRTYGHRTGN
ncbi:electron transport complex subunit RsxD [Shewanella marinintestina]|uniref:electron transport complex subunit RsxD n=1 Tax=Shewanella marinintestina TaxID=190305 RepID=UPI002010B438|nr:electron transport complex subunit RsxD [Shewanella marinintestina]MCL1144639.1 electron transport complex subunit RsxD [Shewanella marinintestina]